MKSLKKLSFILLFALVLLMVPIIPANAKGKISATKKTLTVGKTATIKISGTKKTVKWSTSNNRIKITKKTKKTAKIKAVKAGSAYLKAKVGKKTYKCKVTVKSAKTSTQTITATNETVQDVPTADKITYRLMDTGTGVVAIFTNNNSSVVSLSAQMIYYKNGSVIDYSTESNYAFESGKTCAMKFSPPYDLNFDPLAYDNYEVNISVSPEGDYLVCATDGIHVESNMESGKLITTVRNDSGKNLEFIKVAAVFYDASGNVIAYDYHYAYCEEPGSTDYLTYYFPSDSNYNSITPSRYEVYVNCAYSYQF